MAIKILDLFAGVGGLSLGFEMVKDENGQQVFELHRAVEIDAYACQTLRKNYGEEKVIEGDLTKKEIQNRVIDECKGKVSLIVGGIPCQSFSLIGPRSGYGRNNEKFKEDLRDNLYKEFRDIVQKIKPNMIVIENVKGILSKKTGTGEKIINNIIADFEKQGYNFQNRKNGNKFVLVNAADFGVPQKRERVILIGIKKDWKDISIPEIMPTHYNTKKGPCGQKVDLPYVTLFEAIGDLPKVQPRITMTGLSKKTMPKIRKTNAVSNTGKDQILLDRTLFESHLSKISLSGKKYFEFVRPNGYKFIDHHTARSQQLSDILLFKQMKEGETAAEFIQRKPKLGKKLIKYGMNSFKDKYRKQKSDEPGTTIFAHLEKDGNRFIHPYESRTLTPREAARIQSFPDHFVFEGPLSKKFKQIGNAVPPLMSYTIAKHIYDAVGD